MIYKIFRAFFFSIFKIFNWFQIKNQEQLPTNGPVIVACNHISNWDPMVLGSAVPRIVNFVAKIELFKTPVVGFFMKVWGAIPVKRGRGDREAITRSLEVLESGRVLGIFIEGRRNKGKPDQMLPPQVGAAMLALKSGATVVPAAIINSRRIVWGFRRLQVRFGEPMRFEEQAGVDKKELYQKISQEIAGAIQELLAAKKKK